MRDAFLNDTHWFIAATALPYDATLRKTPLTAWVKFEHSGLPPLETLFFQFLDIFKRLHISWNFAVKCLRRAGLIYYNETISTDDRTKGFFIRADAAIKFVDTVAASARINTLDRRLAFRDYFRRFVDTQIRCLEED